MSLTQKVRVGLRREIILVFPLVVFLLAILSIFTLLSYRRAVAELAEVRRQETRLATTRLAELTAREELPAPETLRALVPSVERLTLLDARGSIVVSRGPEIGADPLAGTPLDRVREVLVAGPDATTPYVSALAPIDYRGRRHYLRIDVGARELARQLAGLKPLTWVVVTANAGLAVLVLFFLRHLLTPYDRLLARAREILPASHEMEDEVALLVDSFERAVEAIRHPETVIDELDTLEKTLGPSLESGLLLIDETGSVLAVNPAGERILGIQGVRQPQPLREALAAHEELSAIITTAVAARRTVQRHEVELRLEDGIRTLGLSVHPLRRHDGSIRAYLVLFADLTETHRKAEAERLATSLEQVGEMAAGLAHEMRNSLATFRGYLTLIDRAPESQPVAEYLSELRRETDHLHRVLEDFLSFAKPGSTRLERIDVGALVERATRDPLLDGLPVVLRSSRARVRGDSELLHRAVRNLLLNAKQALAAEADPQPVTVEVHARGQEVVVRISDRGPGLPAEIRDALFQPFVTGRSDGVGLGLALAHRIVQLHGGRLEVRDRAGGGAVATLELPRVDDGPADVTPSRGSAESPPDRAP